MLRSERWLQLAGIAGSAIGVIAVGLLIAQRGIGRNYASYDLSAYIEAARRLRDGAPLYPQLLGDAYRLGDLNLYLYPPPVALFFMPGLLVPLSVASAIWGTALTAFALILAATIARRVVRSRQPLAFAMVIGAFPLQWELANGNVTLVTLGLALAAWYWTERGAPARWRSGGALALAMGLKLLAVPVTLTLAVAGRARLLAATAGLLAALVALTLPFMGAAWADWVRLTFELAAGPQTKSYTVVPEIARSGVGRALLIAATAAALIALGALVRSRRLDGPLGFSAALAAAPYVSAFVFYPYAVLVLPVVAWLGLGRVPAWARVAAFGAWLLVEAQALDPDTILPTALVGTALAVGATIATGALSPSGARPEDQTQDRDLAKHDGAGKRDVEGHGFGAEETAGRATKAEHQERARGVTEQHEGQ